MNVESIYLNVYSLLLGIVFLYFIIQYKTILLNKNYKKIILFLRINILFALLVFFIYPVVKVSMNSASQKKLHLFIDNSQSINNELKFKDIVYNIHDKIEKWSFDNDVDIFKYSFGDTIKSFDDISSIKFDNTTTNFSSMFEKINYINDDDEIIIISDGIHNYGYNYPLNKVKNKIYTLGIGEDSLFLDIAIDKIEYENINNDSILFNVNLKIESFENISTSKIYLSNNIVQNHIINDMSFDKGDYIYDYDFMIDKNLLSYNNFFHFELLDNDINHSNNSAYFEINKDYLDKKSILLITGIVSKNTGVLKNEILSKVKDSNVTHLYRINDKWNKDPLLYNSNDFDIIVYDNFPLQNVDFTLVNHYNADNEIYLISDIFSNKEFINTISCNVKKNSTITNVNNNLYDNPFYLPPNNNVDEYIDCDNEIILKYSNGSVMLYEYNEKNYFFIEDIYQLNHLTNLINSKQNNLIEYMVEYIENKVYKIDNTISISSYNSSYTIRDSLEIYLSLNDSINIENLYIKSYNDMNEFIVFDNFIKNNDNNYIFKISFDNVGKYSIQGILKKKKYLKSFSINGNDIKIHKSNILTIDIKDKNIETANIYINDTYLKNISQNSNGKYYKYNNYSEIFSLLNTNKIIKTTNEIFNLLKFKFILYIVILFILIEWYLRNKIGLL